MTRDIMADYIPVNERVAAFYEAHPEGSLQSEVIELNDHRVVMRGYAYRSADDAKPGIGHASQEIPGNTSFTKGSEVENCETSAWGRAIAALGFEVKRGIATAEDVRNKQDSPSAGWVAPSPARPVTRPVAVPDGPYADLPNEWDDRPNGKPLDEGQAYIENTCPDHELVWVLRPGGISKSTGKPYDPFWACPSDERPFCKNKPSKAWQARHEG